MNYGKESLKKHQQTGGKLEIKSKFPLKNKTDLSIAYTPGVAQPCLEIARNLKDAYKYTIKKNSVTTPAPPDQSQPNGQTDWDHSQPYACPLESWRCSVPPHIAMSPGTPCGSHSR